MLSSGGKKNLVAFAEKTGIPVISTMMGIGVMPSEHPLYLGMLGSHGVAAANKAIHNADLVIQMCIRDRFSIVGSTSLPKSLEDSGFS